MGEDSDEYWELLNEIQSGLSDSQEEQRLAEAALEHAHEENKVLQERIEELSRDMQQQVGQHYMEFRDQQVQLQQQLDIETTKHEHELGDAMHLIQVLSIWQQAAEAQVKGFETVQKSSSSMVERLQEDLSKAHTKDNQGQARQNELQETLTIQAQRLQDVQDERSVYQQEIRQGMTRELLGMTAFVPLVEEQRDQILDLEQQLLAKKAQQEVVRSEDDLQAQTKEWENQLASRQSQQKLNELQKKLDETQQQVQTKELDVRALTECLKDREQQNAQALSKIRQMETQMSTQDQQFISMEEKLKHLKQTKVNMQKALERQIASLKTIEKQNTQLSLESAELLITSNNADSAIQELKNKSSDMTKDRKGLAQNLKQTQAQVTQLQQENADMQKRMDRQRSKYESQLEKRTANTKASNVVFPRIRNWKVNSKNELEGNVYQHPTLGDGSKIVTSPLSHPSLALAQDGLAETKSGTIYRLGRPQKVTVTTSQPSFPNLSFPKSNPTAAPSTDKLKPVGTREEASRSVLNNAFSKPNSAGGGAVGNKLKSNSPPPKQQKEAPRIIAQNFANILFGAPSSPLDSSQLRNNPTEKPKTALEQRKPNPSFNIFDVSPNNLFNSNSVTIDKKETSKIQKETPKIPKTGESIQCTRGNSWLLAGPLRSSANGRCQIQMAYPADGGKEVMVKLSNNLDAIQREYTNYQKLRAGQLEGHIVKCHGFVKDHKEKSALILERGICDLKQHRNKGNMNDDEIRHALHAAVRCMDKVHQNRMVWTDLKTENFVLTDENTFKAIDLESHVTVKGPPMDYTPEACPPEFAKAYQKDDFDPESFTVEYSYDVWSFGMMAHELATGKGHFDGVSPSLIVQRIAKEEVPTLDETQDERLADLIKKCLEVDPRKRPNAKALLRHPYFRGMPSSSIFQFPSF